MANPGLTHQRGVRTSFRVAGPVLLVVGLLVFVKGATGVFGDMDGFDGPKGSDIACFLGGFLLFGIGLQVTWVGFLGAAARYGAGEVAPVLRDTLGQVADGDDGVDGAGAGRSDRTGPFCSRCGVRQDAEARFCDACGSPVG